MDDHDRRPGQHWSRRVRVGVLNQRMNDQHRQAGHDGCRHARLRVEGSVPLPLPSHPRNRRGRCLDPTGWCRAGIRPRWPVRRCRSRRWAVFRRAIRSARMRRSRSFTLVSWFTSARASIGPKAGACRSDGGSTRQCPHVHAGIIIQVAEMVGEHKRPAALVVKAVAAAMFDARTSAARRRRTLHALSS